MTAEIAFLWTVRLAALSVALCAIEVLVGHQSYRDTGLFGWPVSRTRHSFFVAHPAGRAVGFLFGYRAVLAIQSLRLLGAVSLLALDPLTPGARLATGFIAVTGLVLNGRSSFGMDGADQMSSLTFIALGAHALVPTPFVLRAVLWFLAAEVSLSYIVSGIAKGLGPMWRDGSAIWGILSTRGYGWPPLGLWLRQYPLVCRGLTWNVIAAECAFPLVFLAPAPLAWLMIAGGVSFHLATAFLMGLNTFLWSFLAAYPALIWCVFSWRS